MIVNVLLFIIEVTKCNKKKNVFFFSSQFKQYCLAQILVASCEIVKLLLKTKCNPISSG